MQSVHSCRIVLLLPTFILTNVSAIILFSHSSLLPLQDGLSASPYSHVALHEQPFVALAFTPETEGQWEHRHRQNFSIARSFTSTPLLAPQEGRWLWLVPTPAAFGLYLFFPRKLAPPSIEDLSFLR